MTWLGRLQQGHCWVECVLGIGLVLQAALNGAANKFAMPDLQKCDLFCARVEIVCYLCL